MKGRRSVWIRTGVLEARVPHRSRWRTAWNLDALSDEDLEALLPLSEKQAAAAGEVAWTADEQALMARLWAKATGAHEAARSEATER